MLTEPTDRNIWRRSYLVVLVMAIVLQAVHIANCELSAMSFFPYVETETDMHANLEWAKTIRDQGWTNPAPYHPHALWMLMIAPYEQWVQWWQNPAIFQQSPLYAYLVAAFQSCSEDLIYFRIFQGILGVCLCALMGKIAEEISGQPAIGVLAFLLAALYAPFYVYTWELLRDALGWIITAGVALVWLKLVRPAPDGPAARINILSLIFGLLLGAGYLAREGFLLIAPVSCLCVAAVLWHRRQRAAVLALAVGLGISLFPLILRNHLAHAPLLSSSNRFAEAFIQGNARSAEPFLFYIPDETKSILDATGGRPLPLVKATLATHPSVWSWLKLQGRKVLSLGDPFESWDNVNVYFVEHISPVVKYGLKHWMLITPGLAGLLLGIIRRDKRNWPLWVLFPMLAVSVLVGVPLSRYRQIMMIVWIPWAACYLFELACCLRERRLPKAAVMSAVLLAGWALSLGPLSLCPKNLYERPLEYQKAILIYQKLGQTDKIAAMQALLNQLPPR